MNRTDIINNIRVACRCGERRAGELHYGDLDTACSGLGLEYDSIDYFMAALALN